MSLKKQQRDDISQFILWNISEHPSDIVRLAQNKYKLSRPAVLRYVHELIKENQIDAQGSTSDRRYSLKPLMVFEQTYKISQQLTEDKVWRDDVSPLLKDIRGNVIQICQYGFTEIFNNAIEHSEGTEVVISVVIWIDHIQMRIIDNGVGIFNKIQRTYQLDDPLHAILELSKGKLTTEPRGHTGEGIFFTSRMFDFFTILSGNLRFGHTGTTDLLSEIDGNTQGTTVQMEISTRSERTTNAVFSQFTNEEFGFDKTVVPVGLARYGNENLVSRSQARRLLARLDRFKFVVLDFKGVPHIGRAFADEIFRVFANAHSTITITPINHSSTIRKLINELQNTRQSSG